jgi:hypothetical protein
MSKKHENSSLASGSAAMNTKRILLGGLIAGIIIFIWEGLLWGVLLVEARAAAEAGLGLERVSWGIYVIFLSAILVGLTLAWLYAAIRPRFGSGRATSLKAGVTIWIATFVTFYAWNTPSGRGFIFLAPDLTIFTLVWSLAGVLLAALVARWIYKEEKVTS